jgi:hypothetical protein
LFSLLVVFKQLHAKTGGVHPLIACYTLANSQNNQPI